MDIEKAKQILKSYLEYPEMDNIELMKKAIETVLSELEKKDKIIELMAKELSKLNYIQYCNANNCDYPHCNKEKCIKQYFTKKCEEEIIWKKQNMT